MSIKIPLQLERLVNQRWNAALELIRAADAQHHHPMPGNSPIFNRLQDAKQEYDQLTKQWRRVEHSIVKEEVVERYTKISVEPNAVAWPRVDGAERLRLVRELPK